MKIILILMILILPTGVNAGGDYWQFRVENYIGENSDAATVILIPIEKGNIFPLNCDSLKVRTEYSTIRWWFFGGRVINRIYHRNALKHLEEAYRSGAIVRFGTMGEGFGFTPDTTCSVQSRALSIIKEGKEEVIIYSFYKWP